MEPVRQEDGAEGMHEDELNVHIASVLAYQV